MKLKQVINSRMVPRTTAVPRSMEGYSYEHNSWEDANGRTLSGANLGVLLHPPELHAKYVEATLTTYSFQSAQDRRAGRHSLEGG